MSVGEKNLFRLGFSGFKKGIKSQSHPNARYFRQRKWNNSTNDAAIPARTPSTEVTSGQGPGRQLFLFRFRVQPTAHSFTRTLAHLVRGSTLTPKA